MLNIVLRRILLSIPTFFGVSVLCFALMHIAPGEAIDSLLPEGATPELVQSLRSSYGLDRPIYVQYGYWFAKAIRGDLGSSIATQRPVASEIVPAAVNSLKIALGGMLISLIVGCAVGAFAGLKDGSLVDRALTATSIVGISVPTYWFAMLLVVLFAVNLQWLPASGMSASPGLASQLSHMTLPALALCIVPAGIIARTTRAAVADIARQEFVQALRGHGLPPRTVHLHIAKNAAPRMLAVGGLQFAQMLGGSILVETVFAWPGTGLLLNNAIFSRDLPLIQGIVLVLALIFVLVNLLVDLLQIVFDPRMRRV